MRESAEPADRRRAIKPALVGAETCLVSAMVRLHGECYGGAHCGHALWAAAGGGAAVVGVGGKRDAAGRGGKDRPADGEEGARKRDRG